MWTNEKKTMLLKICWDHIALMDSHPDFGDDLPSGLEVCDIPNIDGSDSPHKIALQWLFLMTFKI